VNAWFFSDFFQTFSDCRTNRVDCTSDLGTAQTLLSHIFACLNTHDLAARIWAIPIPSFVSVDMFADAAGLDWRLSMYSNFMCQKLIGYHWLLVCLNIGNQGIQKSASWILMPSGQSFLEGEIIGSW